MKRIATLGAAVIAVAFTAAALRAAPADYKNVPVSATVGGTDDITTFGVYDMSNVEQAPGSAIEFPSPDNALSWSAKGNRYVKLAVTEKFPKWILRTYTDNFNFVGGVLPDTTTWGYQYGGLKGPVYNSKGQMSGLAWLVLPDTGVVFFGGPDASDPSEMDPVISTKPASNWLYVKDLSDQDIPDALDPSGKDQSFAGSGGYTTVATGTPTLTKIIMPREGPENDYAKLLDTSTSPFYFFLGASFKELAPGDYGATVGFELLNL